MYRYVMGLLLVLFASQFTYGQFPESQKITLPESNLNNLYRIDTDVYRSEQPDSKDFKALEEFGITEVLNLRNSHSDNKRASSTSLSLHRVKMRAFFINQNQLIEALRIIRNRQGPIVIHCKHGSDRAGAVIAMYRIIFQGVSKEEAIREMKEGGFGFHKICWNIPSLIRTTDIEVIRKALED